MHHELPIVDDLYCGLGGWADGFLAEGYRVRGYDIEAHDYGTGGYPGELILRDVRGIHGSELKDAAVIVGSSPCQEFSYRAMPWKRAKALPPPYLGMELFNAQFRIQREASEAAGHHIPMVVENVRGAQKWVGRAAWNYGSFYLWGDVPALMPVTFKGTKGTKPVPNRGWTQGCAITLGLENYNGHKVPGFRFDGSGKSFQTASVMKQMGVVPDANSPTGLAWADDGIKGIPHRTAGHWRNPAEHEGVKFAAASSREGFDGKPKDKMLGNQGPAAFGSKSNARKAASAMIARIPFPLASHIAKCFKPRLTNEH